MEQSPNLTLPYIMPSQAQKHVTHNEAVRMLDSLVQLGVFDRDLAAPPGDPAEGDRYIVAEGGEEEWSGHDGEVAAWQDGAWAFLAPRTGWLAWIGDEERLVVFDGAQWSLVGAETAGVATLGINATPDDTCRLAVGSAAALFTHDGDDHRLVVNKAAAGDTASIVFQTGYEGRAEIGLAGDDRFWFKVSEDGEAFSTAIVIDEKTGAASFPATPCGMVNLIVNGDFAINQRGFAGGSLAAGTYGYDRWKAGSGGCSVSASGGVVTHASGPLVQVVESPGLADATVALSVEGLTGGDLAVDIEGETGVIEAGAGRRAVTLTVPSGSTGNVVVTLEPVSAAVTYGRVQLNEGAEALRFERRHPAQELALCQRYYVTISGGGFFLHKRRESDRVRCTSMTFPVTMRGSPSVTLMGANASGHTAINVQSVTPASFYTVTTGAGADNSQPLFTGYTADAEL